MQYEAFCHIGVAVQVIKPEPETFEQWEYQALRLLGSEARMRMLWAMLDKPMSARELPSSWICTWGWCAGILVICSIPNC